MSEVRRWEYTGVGIGDEEAPERPWPIVAAWVEQARVAGERGEVHEPSAMAVATVDADGLPDVRTVLMRFFDERGPGFVSSRHSAKADQIRANSRAAATLTWSPLFRAIRFRGEVVEIAPDEAEAYWRSRPWGSRISALASRQSHPVAGRGVLEEASAAAAKRYPDTGDPDDVPAPPDWVGYRIRPTSVELWAGRPDRLHDRIVYRRDSPGGLDDDGWRHERLQP